MGGKRRQHIPVFFEVDVAAAREGIGVSEKNTAAGLSFTTWVVKCVARAAGEYRRVHAPRAIHS